MPVQTSRIQRCAHHFVPGVGVGVYGVDAGLLSPALPRQWAVWQGMAGVLQPGKGALHPALPVAASLAFTLSCAASSLMLLSFFVRFRELDPAVCGGA